MRAVDLTGRRFGHLLVTALDGTRRNVRTWRCRCDCGRERSVEGGNLTSGRSTSCGCARPGRARQTAPSYGAAHGRVRRERGAATEHLCTDCGQAAAQWSFVGTAEHTLTQRIGSTLVAYSGDPADYSPRCVACHVAFDRDRPRDPVEGPQ